MEQVLRLLAGLFVGVWVARYLGPEQYGVFSYVLAFSAIFAGIAKLGLDGIVVRELVRHPESYYVYLGTAFWLKVAGAFFVLILLALIVPFTENDARTNVFIFVVATSLIFQGFEVVEFYFQSRVMAKMVSVCKVTQILLSSAIKIYLILIKADLIWFVLVIAFDALYIAIGYAAIYRVAGSTSFLKSFNFSLAKELLRDSWPLIFSAFFAMVYLRIDQVMIKGVLGSYDAGIYSAAVKLSESLYFIPVLLTASLFPAILNAKDISVHLYHERLLKLYSLLVWLAISASLLFSLFGQSAVKLLYGSAYSDAGDVLIVHVWASVFVFISAGFGRYLIAENLVIINMYRVVLGAILNIILNIYMIKGFGVVGAAYSTLISLFFVNFLFDIFNVKLHTQLKFKVSAFFLPFVIVFSAVQKKKYS